MAETLQELIVRIKADATELEKGLTGAEKQTEASSKKMSDSLKKIGTGMAVAGAAITAAMGLMGKAAIDEQINIKRLATTMHNAGTEYDDVRDSLEALISTTQRKTGVADNEQRDILNRLILVTKDYNKALELLPTTLDLAAAGSMDATTAATYLGKAYLELEDGADEVTVRFGQASLQFKSMEDIQNRVAGSAENLVNPLDVLKATMGDVSEVIGSFLVPHIKEMIGKIVDVAIKIQNWAKEHPELARQLAILTSGLGIALTVIGGLILAIPKLTVAWKALSLAFTASPIGWVVVGLTAIGLAVIGVIDKINQQREATKKLSDEYYANLAAQEKAGEVAITYVNGMTHVEKVTKGVTKATSALKDIIKPTTDEIKKKIEELKAEYGDLGNAIKSKGDMARQAAQTAKDALASELDKARESTDKQLGFLSKLYAEKIRLVNAGAESAIKSIQDQIDAIDQQTELENQALEDKYDQDRLAKLSGEERTDFLAEIERKKLLREREDRKDALRDSIEKVRTDTQNKVDKLNEELSTAQQVERDRLTATENRINETNIKLDVALEKELARLATELKEAEKQEIAKLGVLNNALLKEEEANQSSYNKRLEQAKEYQRQLYEIMGGETLPSGTTGMAIPTGGLKTTPWGVIVGPGERAVSPSGEVFVGAEGGIVTQPTMSLIGEAGPEAVIPLNEIGSMGGVTINFTQPIFFDREDTMNRFVDMIRKGIQRQDRLRFGGAYSG